MTDERKKFIDRRCRALYREHAGPFAAFSTAFLFLSLIAFIPVVLSPLFLIVTVPFIFLPAVFSMQISINEERHGKQVTFGKSVHYFFAYFAEPFRGVYRALVLMLKAVGAFFILTFALSFIYTGIAQNDPTLLQEINELNELFASGSTAGIAEYISGHPSLATLINVVTLVCVYGAMMMVLLSVSKMAMSCYTRLHYPAPSRAVTYFYLGMRGMTAPERRKLEWKSYFYFPILYTAGYVGGALIGLLFTGESSLLLACGLMGGILLIAYFLPFYFLHSEFYSHHFHPVLVEFSIRTTEESLSRLRATHAAPPEVIAQYEEDLAKAKEQLKVYDETKFD